VRLRGVPRIAPNPVAAAATDADAAADHHADSHPDGYAPEIEEYLRSRRWTPAEDGKVDQCSHE
jgi:hypothetical protein